jgi:hypothetical protein
MFELDLDGVVERQIILQLRRRTPSLLRDCASLPALLGLLRNPGHGNSTCGDPVGQHRAQHKELPGV